MILALPKASFWCMVGVWDRDRDLRLDSALIGIPYQMHVLSLSPDTFSTKLIPFLSFSSINELTKAQYLLILYRAAQKLDQQYSWA